MEAQRESKEKRRVMQAVGSGLLIGLFILSIFLLPRIVQKRVEVQEERIRQHNLTASQGEAFDSFAREEIILHVLLDGEVREGMSAAADQGFWEVEEDGKLSLSLAPNPYTFVGIFENRRRTVFDQVKKGGKNEWVLDIGKTPFAPEMLMMEVEQGKEAVIALDMDKVDELKTENLPEDVLLKEEGGKYFLHIAAERPRRTFHCIRLQLENSDGQTFSYIVLKEKANKQKIPIYTAEDLSRMREDLNGSYELMNDIDMSKIDDWAPIGTENYPFTGSLDGRGFEIKGFHAPKRIEEASYFALFGVIKNAHLHNFIVREPIIEPQVPEREIGIYSQTAVIGGLAKSSLIENCAVFGGRVVPSDGMCGGLFGGAGYSVIRNCFNSAEVFCKMLNRYLPNTGGIVGGSAKSYITYCANEGSVKGNHLSGGICGYGDTSDIRFCINSGYVWGSTIVGAVPAGGIIQSNDNGSVGYSYFVRGSSAIGAHSNHAVVSVLPITQQELRDPKKLSMLGSFEGEDVKWAYSKDTKGPMPAVLYQMIQERMREKNGL